MAMTMTQKILTAHSGKKEVIPGEMIMADLDLVLGNDITSPVAINEYKSARVRLHLRLRKHRARHGPLRAQQGHKGCRAGKADA
jgi:homoaconitase/3-isopropylmalate dehydratase large subunit